MYVLSLHVSLGPPSEGRWHTYGLVLQLRYIEDNGAELQYQADGPRFLMIMGDLWDRIPY